MDIAGQTVLLGVQKRPDGWLAHASFYRHEAATSCMARDAILGKDRR